MNELYDLLELEVGRIEDARFDEAFFSWSKQDIERNRIKYKQAVARRAAIQAEIDSRQNR